MSADERERFLFDIPLTVVRILIPKLTVCLRVCVFVRSRFLYDFSPLFEVWNLVLITPTGSSQGCSTIMLVERKVLDVH